MAIPRPFATISRFRNLEYPSAFTGASNVARSLRDSNYNATIPIVARQLSKLPAYVQHKRVVRKFRRLQTFAAHLDRIWQADLLPVERWSDSNDGVRYILTVKDIFSKYGWARTLRTKEAREVAVAVKDIISSSGREPVIFQSDQGNEFRGHVASFLESHGIKKAESVSDLKCSSVENFNKILKKRIVRYQTQSHSHRYIEALPRIVTAINNTRHALTGVAPSSVTYENQSNLFYAKYHGRSNFTSKPIHKYDVNERVLTAFPERTFRRGYEQNFHPEHFFVHQVLRTDPVTYRLRDLKDRVLQKKYYEPQLTAMRYTEGQLEDLEVLETRGEGREKEALIHFFSAPTDMTQWVKYSKVKHFQQNGK